MKYKNLVLTIVSMGFGIVSAISVSTLLRHDEQPTAEQQQRVQQQQSEQRAAEEYVYRAE